MSRAENRTDRLATEKAAEDSRGETSGATCGSLERRDGLFRSGEKENVATEKGEW